jgi:prophage regulatory protein
MPLPTSGIFLNDLFGKFSHVPVPAGAIYRRLHMAEQIRNALTILRRRQVEARIGLSRGTIYAKLKLNPKRPGDFDPSFPRPVNIGAKAVSWVESEIDEWLNAQIKKSRNPAQTQKHRAT